MLVAAADGVMEMQDQAPLQEQEIGVVTHYWSQIGVAGVHLEEPVDVGDHIHVLDSGEIIEDGPPQQIKTSEKVRHAYMGTQAEAGGPVL